MGSASFQLRRRLLLTTEGDEGKLLLLRAYAQRHIHLAGRGSRRRHRLSVAAGTLEMKGDALAHQLNDPRTRPDRGNATGNIGRIGGVVVWRLLDDDRVLHEPLTPLRPAERPATAVSRRLVVSRGLRCRLVGHERVAEAESPSVLPLAVFGAVVPPEGDAEADSPMAADLGSASSTNPTRIFPTLRSERNRLTEKVASKPSHRRPRGADPKTAR